MKKTKYLFLILVLLNALFGCNSTVDEEGIQSEEKLHEDILVKEEGNIFTSVDHKTQLTLPRDWSFDGKGTREELGAQIYLSHEGKKKYLYTDTEEKEMFVKTPSLREYYDYVKDELSLNTDFIYNLNDPQPLTINENKALQFISTKKVDNMEFKYLITLIESRKNFHRIVIWTNSDKFKEYKDEFKSISHSFYVKSEERRDYDNDSKGYYLKSSDNKFKIKIPSKWFKEDESISNRKLSVTNATRDIYGRVYFQENITYEDSDEVLSLLDMYYMIKDQMKDKLEDSKIKGPSTINVDDLEAIEFEVFGSFNNLKISHYYTIIKVEEGYYEFIGSTTHNFYKGARQNFKMMIDSFKLQ